MAAKHCESLTSQQVDAACDRIDGGCYYKVPPGDFLEGPQDARGLPVGYGNGFCKIVRCDIYDYDSIPDVVVCNGHDDWPLKIWEPVMMA